MGAITIGWLRKTQTVKFRLIQKVYLSKFPNESQIFIGFYLHKEKIRYLLSNVTSAVNRSVIHRTLVTVLSNSSWGFLTFFSVDRLSIKKHLPIEIKLSPILTMVECVIAMLFKKYYSMYNLIFCYFINSFIRCWCKRFLSLNKCIFFPSLNIITISFTPKTLSVSSSSSTLGKHQWLFTSQRWKQQVV